MKRNFTLAIPTPCHENWEQFTPTQKGRFCGSCQKEVIDFTTWNEEQIKQYFVQRPTSTCGRFAPRQLITYQNHPHRNPKRQKRFAAALAFILLLISRPSEAQPSPIKADQEQVDKNKNLRDKVISVARITIKGVVASEDAKELLPGVNVVRKGTTQGTVTDADGKFELVIDHPKSIEALVTSFIGLTTVEYEVVTDSLLKEIKILMPYDTAALNEVVVSGGILVGGVVATRWYSPRGLWWKVKNIFRGR